MTFEVYKPRIKNANSIALTKNHIVFKPDILEKLNAEIVELAYDKSDKIIRIRPANSEDGFVVNDNKICSKGFYNYFNIETKGKFPFKFDESDKAILIDISTDT